MGNHGVSEIFRPDHTIFHNPAEHDVFQAAMQAGKQFLINKEELGNDSQKGECGYNIFPSPASYDLVKPVFLVRDPIRTFDSWKHVDWKDIDSLVDCYHNLFRIMNFSDILKPHTVLYERLIRNPLVEVKRICQWWEIPFSDEFLDFKQPLGSFLFNNKREKEIYCEIKPRGIFSTVEKYSGVVQDVPCHNLVSTKEKEYIENKIGRLYLDLWKAKVLDVRTILKEKEWFGFDLDDTLHEFRVASGAATEATLSLIAEEYVLPLADLKKTYSEVLVQKTSSAFVEGKSSHEYRKERFSAVLEHHSVQLDDSFIISKLLVTYERTLTATLKLKCGAFALLKLLKSLGKKIVVITEGPEDAQERTIQALGIADMIDSLATTNSFGVSKTNGLFKKMLAHLNITAADIVYIGDNEDRDITPALAEGIYSIHYAEQKHFSLDTNPVIINTLRKLEYIIS
jgi:putative hydrolase of the HAD superfamily